MEKFNFKKESEMTTILVVDDNSEYRSMLQSILERAGYHVIVAADGDIGLRLYRENKPDLAITDLIMPNREGLGLIMSLKKEFPDVRIIAISGGGKFDTGEFLEIAKDLGAVCALQKPFEHEVLLDTVKKCLPY